MKRTIALMIVGLGSWIEDAGNAVVKVGTTLYPSDPEDYPAYTKKGEH